MSEDDLDAIVAAIKAGGRFRVTGSEVLWLIEQAREAKRLRERNAALHSSLTEQKRLRALAEGEAERRSWRGGGVTDPPLSLPT